MQAACCVTTRGVEAARPSDDAWEAARTVCSVPGARNVQSQDWLWFCLCFCLSLAPFRAIRLEEARRTGHPSRGAWPTRPEQNADLVAEAYQNGLIGQSLAGHVVESPITALGSNVSQPYNTPRSVVECREWNSRS